MTLSLFTTVSKMILRSYTAKLASVALTLVSVGLGGTKAIAQTTYPFTGNYDTAIDVVPFGQDISQSIEFTTSTDAPYGLTQYEGLIYTQTDPATVASNLTQIQRHLAYQIYQWATSYLREKALITNCVAVLLPLLYLTAKISQGKVLVV